MLTAAQVAQQLGISARAVYDIPPEQLARHQFGRAVRYAEEDVEAYRNACRSTETKSPGAGASTSTAKRNPLADVPFPRFEPARRSAYKPRKARPYTRVRP